MLARWLLSLSGLLLAVPCAAQDASGDQIIVEASPPLDPAEVAQRVRDAYPSRVLREPVMRFHDPVCVQVNGLGPKGNALVLNHMPDLIRSLGIRQAPPECLANAVVILATEPITQLERLHAQNPNLLPAKELRRKSREFSAGAHAVVWHHPHFRGANGEALLFGGSVAGAVADQFVINAPINNNGRASHARADYSLTARAGVVTYDATKLDNVELRQLAHHAVMRLLAPDFTPDVEPGSPDTILSGIARGTGPRALTRFDRAVLTALYEMQPDAFGLSLASAAGKAYESEE